MNTKITALALAVIAVLGIGAFVLSGDDDTSDDNNQTTNSSQSAASPLTLNNLAPLSQGIYEGWIVRGDDKFSIGTFNTTTSGQLDTELDLSSVAPVDGDKVVVTIEPTPDADPEPSEVVVLAGDLSGGKADLAFPVDLASFSGKYITGTPTNDPVGLENSGVWFVIPGSPVTASLDIPVAPDGWIYEGWVVYEGQPYSTGKFADPAAADDFSDFSGTSKTAPNFPGEDFVRNLPDGSDYFDLANGSTNVVVSIEPNINGVDPTGEGPAQVKPLAHLISADIVDHSPTDLVLDTSAPSGSFSL